jgi:peptidoglycan/LPS O-acetylase OafA/YrhL
MQPSLLKQRGRLSREGHRADIDGLRAVAVLAVIANHAREGVLPSGYLGVDIFFVISGFVITQALFLNKIEGLWPFLGYFYARRIKRLMPALLVCVGLSSIVVLNLDSMPGRSLLTGAYSLFGLANINLYLQELDYFAPSTRYNAFMHMWSLGVEEQFYLFFPFMIWLLFHKGKVASGRTAGVFIAVVALMSLVSFLYLFDLKPMASYYLLPMRFWELGTGTICAIIARGFPATRKDASVSGRWCQLLPMVLLPVLCGLFLASSCCGALKTVTAVAITAALLLIGARQVNQSFLIANNMASYIGRLSYSLYLWHWPILTFALLAPTSIFSDPIIFFLLLITLSMASYHFIETPLRYRTWRTNRLAEISLGLASATFLCGIIIFGLHFPDKFRVPFLERWHSLDSALRPSFLPLLESGLPYDPTCVVDDESRPLTDRTFSDCTVSPQAGKSGHTIWTMGDSHAGHLQGMLYKLRDLTGIGVHLVETPGHSFPAPYGEDFVPRMKLFELALEKMKPGDIVLLGRLYFSRGSGTSVLNDVAPWTEAVAKLATNLGHHGVFLVIVGPLPIFQFEDIRACDPGMADSCSFARNTLEPVIVEVRALLDSVARLHKNVTLYYPFDFLCPSDKLFCSPLRDNIFIFRDRDHLNAYGSAMLAEDFLTVVEGDGIHLRK